MSTAQQVEEGTKLRPRRRPSRALILIAGAVLIPLVLALIFTSYHTVTEESAVRQAFALVAGQTIAMLTAIAVVVVTAVERRWRELPLFVVIALAVISSAVSSLTRTGEQLLQLLSTVA
jgi:Co/Zn/Cd efflux system component